MFPQNTHFSQSGISCLVCLYHALKRPHCWFKARGQAPFSAKLWKSCSRVQAPLIVFLHSRAEMQPPWASIKAASFKTNKKHKKMWNANKKNKIRGRKTMKAQQKLDRGQKSKEKSRVRKTRQWQEKKHNLWLPWNLFMTLLQIRIWKCYVCKMYTTDSIRLNILKYFSS